jgi:uncharacterized protein YcbX
VAWIHVSPVKGMALVAAEELRLDASGAPGDRQFALVDDTRRVINGVKLGGGLSTFRAVYDERTGELRIQPPDGDLLRGRTAGGRRVRVTLAGRQLEARLAPGPWDALLTDWFGQRLRLVRFERPGLGLDRSRVADGGVTLLSRASLARLGQAAGGGCVDPRRFRMTFGIDGADPFEEDGWIGRIIQVGDAMVRPLGHVGRCVVTTHNPDTGMGDFDTLRILARLRHGAVTTERVSFGVWARVERPGVVRVGDAVVPNAGRAGRRASG